jgi:hypothetical protein
MSAAVISLQCEHLQATHAERLALNNCAALLFSANNSRTMAERDQHLRARLWWLRDLDEARARLRDLEQQLSALGAKP